MLLRAHKSEVITAATIRTENLEEPRSGQESKGKGQPVRLEWRGRRAGLRWPTSNHEELWERETSSGSSTSTARLQMEAFWSVEGVALKRAALWTQTQPKESRNRAMKEKRPPCLETAVKDMVFLACVFVNSSLKTLYLKLLCLINYKGMVMHCIFS